MYKVTPRKSAWPPFPLKGNHNAFGQTIASLSIAMKMVSCGTFLMLASSAFGAESSGVDADGIIRKSVAVTNADWKAAPNYSFHERDVISKKDRAGTTKTFAVLIIEGSPYNKLIAVNDRPLSKEEQAVQDQKLEAEIAARSQERPHDRKRRIAKYQRERAQDQAMIREMVDAFDFKLESETKLNGRDVYQFKATPKPGYVPKSRDTKVLTAMNGTLWVDKETNQWVKVMAQVMRPVSFYGIAKVGPGTRFELEQEPVSGNLWLPKHFAVHVNASALGFINEDSNDDETYSNYRPTSQALELQAKK